MNPHDTDKKHSTHELLNQVAGLREYLLGLCESFHMQTRPLHPKHLMSAKNLLQYVALRQHDIRPLQEDLMQLGLSSLGRAEPHVMASVDAVHHALQCVAREARDGRTGPCAHVSVEEGRALLEAHTEQLLGPRPEERWVRILVTLPSEAAQKPELLRELLEAGTDCVRINCAHDDAETWAAMIAHLRTAEKSTGRTCRILMDLGGPKLRTGPLGGQQIVKARVQRSVAGNVVAPASIWFAPPDEAEPARGQSVCVSVKDAAWLGKLKTGTRVQLEDARGTQRMLKVVEQRGTRWRAESSRACYIRSGAVLSLRDGIETHVTCVGELPETEEPLLLRKGDMLMLTRSLEPGVNARRDAAGAVQAPARIGCTLPAVFAQTKPGERIWFDDGKIGGVIREVHTDWLSVEITQARDAGEKLRGDKGINLPESELNLPALTEKDIRDLEFVAHNADMVGLSFVQNPSDVADLNARLRSLDGRDVGIVLKIETRRAFQRLPELLLAAMHAPMAGVMIARGDLAIECGFERMAEVQEEILWICEAAHVPAIWATQVLESAAKTGQPSRAEITDAAMAARAECVMLNKGPCILEAVRILNDILCRMQEHQSKKRALLRRLASWSPPVNA